MTAIREGDLAYTNRAYQQDMAQAMRNEIIAGLIELLTNADDAYKVAGKSGRIEIEVSTVGLTDGYGARVAVKDNALGLSAEHLERKITTIGGANEERARDEEGRVGTRGLFGRGAKDVASFGQALYEAVKDGKYSAILIDGRRPRFEVIAEAQEATDVIRQKMALRENENGVMASIFIETARMSALPTPLKLIQQLERHVSLRSILSQHEVFLRDSRSGQDRHLQTFDAEGEIVIDKFIALKGYRKDARLLVRKLKERQSDSVGPYTQHGIVVRDDRANYENTFFAVAARPESGWFSGEFICPEIDDLARERDLADREPENLAPATIEFLNKNNPKPLILRTREGLEPSHPYYRALAMAVQSELSPLFDQVAKQENALKSAGAKLTKDLNALGRSLAQLMQTALEEAELDDEIGGDDSGEPDLLALLPPIKKVKLGKVATLTVWIPDDGGEPDSTRIEIKTANPDIAIRDALPLTNWTKHPRFAVLVNQVHIVSGGTGSADIELYYGGGVARSRVLIVSLDDNSEAAPEELAWERTQLGITPSKGRTLRVLAPAEFLGTRVKFETNEPGLVTLSGESVFRLNPTKSFCYAPCHIETGPAEGALDLIASSEGQLASCRVTIREATASSGPRIQFDFRNQDSPTRSALFQDGEVLEIRVFARHRAIRNLIGEHDGSKYKREDKPDFRAALAEIIALEVANHVIQLETTRYPERYQDAASLLARQQNLLPKFLVPLQGQLLD